MFKNCKIQAAGVDARKYHSEKGERGKPDFVMSPSQFKAGSVCWRRWVDGYNPPDSTAKDFGNLVDTLLLTPDLFKARYRIRPEFFPDAKGVPSKSGNTTACKEWISACAKGGFEVVSKDEVAEANVAVKRLRANDVIADFLDASDKQVHVVGEWHDEKTKLVIPVECLVDALPRPDTEFFKAVGDLKSATSGLPFAFAKVAKKYGYHIQAAFDLDMIVAAEKRNQDEERNTWSLIGVESFPPYQPFKRMYDATVDDGLISFGRNSYQIALSIYAHCLKTGHWFDYDDDPRNDPDKNTAQGWTILRPEAWEAYESLSEKLQFDAAEALQENEDLTP